MVAPPLDLPALGLLLPALTSFLQIQHIYIFVFDGEGAGEIRWSVFAAAAAFRRWLVRIRRLREWRSASLAVPKARSAIR